MAVAGNALTPDEVLAQLAQDTDELVRLAVAGNPTPRPEFEEMLSHSTDPWVRAVLADKYRDSAVSLPWPVQRRLSRDPEKEVRQRTAVTTNYLDIFEALMADPLPMVRAYCPRNPRVTRDQLSTLMNDRSYVVRASVAGGWAADFGSLPDDEQLTRLASDRSVVVRHNVLTRYYVPPAALELLKRDHDDAIRREARRLIKRGPRRITVVDSLGPGGIMDIGEKTIKVVPNKLSGAPFDTPPRTAAQDASL